MAEAATQSFSTSEGRAAHLARGARREWMIQRLKVLVGSIPVIGLAARATYRKLKRPTPFAESSSYWDERYRSGGHSGFGSYGVLAEFKANYLNAFVTEHEIQTVIEYGVGDGNQLLRAHYPSYVGYDVSSHAVARCVELFADDATKSFRSMADHQGETAELTLSLDVVYHLVEDDVYERYMHLLFDSAERFVIIYSSNEEVPSDVPHVRNRRFTDWVEAMRPDWRLREHVPNEHPFTGDFVTGSRSDFFVYERT